MSSRGTTWFSDEPYNAVPGSEESPVLSVPLAVWQKLQGYIQECPTEVNGFGYIDRTTDGFYLEDVFILEQTATSHGVNTSSPALHKHLYEMVKSGKDTGRIRFQWHSHVNFGAYFSPTDTDNIGRYPGDWMISLVGNKRGEYEVRLDLLKPVWVTLPLEVKIKIPTDPALAAQCREDIRRNVHQPKRRRKDSPPRIPVLAKTFAAFQLFTGGEHS